MTANPTDAPSSRPRFRRRTASASGRVWFALSCVAIAVFAPLPYLTQSWSDLAEAGQGLAEHYAAQSAAIRWSLIVHATAGGLALLMTPVMASARLRRRRPVWHRRTGRVLLASILVAAGSGLVIAQVSYAGLVGTIGFSMLAVLWAASAVGAVRAAMRLDRRAHRAWTMRTLALTYAAVTLRLWVGILIAAQRPATDAAAELAFDRAYSVVPFLCWVPNLLVAEWVLRRRPVRSAAATMPTVGHFPSGRSSG